MQMTVQKPAPEPRRRTEGIWEMLKNRTADRSEERGRIYELPIEAILPNRAQPRRHFEEEAIVKLADSIRQYGILQPLTVRRIEDLSALIGGVQSAHPGAGAANENKCSFSEKYELIAGERRLRAARLLHLSTVPCLILEADSRRSAELAIIENLQREDLNMFEEANAISSLMAIYHMTQEQVAACLSLSQSCVANKLRILRLDEEERQIILSHRLTERHARALLKISNPDKRLSALEYIAGRQLNVSASERYIEELVSAAPSATVPRPTKRRFIIKDMRLFYNSIDRAIDTVRRAGITVDSRKKEENGVVELVITLPAEMQYRR